MLQAKTSSLTRTRLIGLTHVNPSTIQHLIARNMEPLRICLSPVNYRFHLFDAVVCVSSDFVGGFWTMAPSDYMMRTKCIHVTEVRANKKERFFPGQYDYDIFMVFKLKMKCKFVFDSNDYICLQRWIIQAFPNMLENKHLCVHSRCSFTFNGQFIVYCQPNLFVYDWHFLWTFWVFFNF